jgi:hypothetical protein
MSRNLQLHILTHITDYLNIIKGAINLSQNYYIQFLHFLSNILV